MVIAVASLSSLPLSRPSSFDEEQSPYHSCHAVGEKLLFLYTVNLVSIITSGLALMLKTSANAL